MNARRYGWKPDVPDHRDYLFAAVVHLPGKVRTIGRDVPVEDQGSIGSCTGNATTSALEIVTRSTRQLSRLMAYYNGRELEGSTATDNGAAIRDVIKGLAKLGVCSEPRWPYLSRNVTRKPTSTAYREAKQMIPRVASYQRVSSFLHLRAALAEGLPVVFGFMVPDYFEGESVARRGWLRLPTKSDAMIGGHAVLGVGYDVTVATPYVMVRNSWGVDWGLAGYFKMDARWFTDPRRLVDDMWVIRPAT